MCSQKILAILLFSFDKVGIFFGQESYLHMHIKYLYFSEELPLLVVPRIAVKEHPWVAQPGTKECQKCPQLLYCCINWHKNCEVVTKISIFSADNLKDLVKQSTSQRAGRIFIAF